MGIQNCIGNLAGMTAPIVTGMVVDRTGHFASAFAIAAVLAAIGILAFALIVRRIEPIGWGVAAAAETADPAFARAGLTSAGARRHAPPP
jgi:dipeptide/tripeptide permease